LQDSFNLNSLSGLSSFLKRVLWGTLAVELTGALLYMTVFIPEFGARGIWISVFNAVSAFCNAGMDIIGENSLMDYATSPMVNGVTSALIILGGLGFPVWWDVLRVLGLSIRKRNPRALSHLTLQSKMTLSATAILLLGGGLLILILERDNPATLGGMSLFDQIQAALFQSVTTRTAGFATVDQAALTPATTALCLILMFIGGSPVGTAGGVKTVTVLVLAVYAFSTVRGKNEVGLFNRRIPREALRKSVAVVGMSFLIAAVSTLLLAAATPHRDLADILYETVSATATVGLSRNLTPTLTTVGKLTTAVTMYLGRVGPISLAVAFGVTKEKQNIVNNPTEPVSVG
jgi:trk system potassium uptake protein TrkH